MPIKPFRFLFQVWVCVLRRVMCLGKATCICLARRRANGTTSDINNARCQNCSHLLDIHRFGICWTGGIRCMSGWMRRRRRRLLFSFRLYLGSHCGCFGSCNHYSLQRRLWEVSSSMLGCCWCPMPLSPRCQTQADMVCPLQNRVVGEHSIRQSLVGMVE
ncbi:hypothetical protein V8C37DRAFT_392105 [Trichoderma ceciliae]